MKKHKEEIILLSIIDLNLTSNNLLKDFLKSFKHPAFSGIYIIVGWMDHLLNTPYHEKKEKRGEFPSRCAWIPLLLLFSPYL